jgi:UDP-GlcNAc:undecaprenyl-phosphate GlcNAc-1-phosphate transferase
LALSTDQYLLGALAMILSGASFGFLIWNRNPARIYMGDAGSLFMGTLLAGLLVRFEPNPVNKFASLSIPVLLMAIPILDTSVAVTSRLRRGKSPFEGGRDHLSHRLLRRGIARKTTAYILWFLSSAFALLAIIISSVPYKYESLISGLGLMTWTLLYIGFMRESDE